MHVLTVWDRIAGAGPAVVVLVTATAASLALPVLRRLAPRNRRHRGGPARLLLGLAVLLAFGAMAIGTMGAASPGNMLQLAGLLALVLGLVGMGGLFVFDVILPRLRIDVPSIMRDLLLVTVAVVITMGFLRLAGLDVFSLVTTSAVLTAIIGLALQSTIANVFGGLGLQLDRTLRHGEWIEVGGRVGKILEIGWRSTRIQTKDGDTAFVPNGELISKEVLKFAQPVGAHRMTVRIGFHYRHPPNEVREVLVRALREVPGIVDDPAPACGPIEFAESAVVYALRYWIRDFAHDTNIDEEVLTRIWYAAERAGLEIPFPTRTVLSEHSIAAARAAAGEEDQSRALRRLGALEPLGSVDIESWQRQAPAIRRVRFARGETVVGADDSDGALYLIDSGEIAVRRRVDAAIQPVAIFGADEIIGQRLISKGEQCVAHSDVALYRLDRCVVDGMLAADSQLAGRLSAITAARQAAFDELGRSSGAGPRDLTARRPVRLASGIRELFGRR